MQSKLTIKTEYSVEDFVYMVLAGFADNSIINSFMFLLPVFVMYSLFDVEMLVVCLMLYLALYLLYTFIRIVYGYTILKESNDSVLFRMTIEKQRIGLDFGGDNSKTRQSMYIKRQIQKSAYFR